MTTQTIKQHEGKKYLRLVIGADADAAHGAGAVRRRSAQIDVYAVIEAFGVSCPARQHALKKLLCAGTRGKGDAVADLVGALAAVSRAIEMERIRQLDGLANGDLEIDAETGPTTA